MTRNLPVQRRGKQVALTLLQPPRIKGDCNGEPGYCMVLTCRENLTLEVTNAGSLHVLPSPGRGSLHLPVRQDRRHVVSAEVRALYNREDDAVTDAVLARQDWLLERYGSACWRDVREVLGEDATLEELGELWGVTRQRVEQIGKWGDGVLRRELGDGDKRPHGLADLRENLDAMPHGSAVRPVGEG